MWVYVKTNAREYKVGYYSPAGQWQHDSSHDDQDHAAARTAWLNGSHRKQPLRADKVKALVDGLKDACSEALTISSETADEYRARMAAVIDAEDALIDYVLGVQDDDR